MGAAADIDLIEALEISEDSFAVQMPDGSMLPKFRAGDVLLVQPQSPLDTGNFVLVEIRTEDGEIEGYVRRYGGRTDKGIETEILSPPTVIFVPFEQIECVGRITVCREAK